MLPAWMLLYDGSLEARPPHELALRTPQLLQALLKVLAQHQWQLRLTLVFLSRPASSSSSGCCCLSHCLRQLCCKHFAGRCRAETCKL